MTLEEQFHQDMLNGCQTLKKECKYNPTYFLQMVREHGGVKTAKLLLQSSDVQEGLMKLWELGRLEMSMENVVLQAKYQSLFTDAERKIARLRLEKLNYKPKTG